MLLGTSLLLTATCGLLNLPAKAQLPDGYVQELVATTPLSGKL